MNDNKSDAAYHGRDFDPNHHIPGHPAVPADPAKKPMSRKRKILVGAGVAVVGLLALGQCGGDSEPTQPAPVTQEVEPTQEPMPAPDPQPTPEVVAPPQVEPESDLDYNGRERVYLQTVRDYETTLGNQTDEWLIDFGNAVCGDLSNGMTGDDVIAQILVNAPDYGIAMDLAYASGVATATICPEHSSAFDTTNDTI